MAELRPKLTRKENRPTGAKTYLSPQLYGVALHDLEKVNSSSAEQDAENGWRQFLQIKRLFEGSDRPYLSSNTS